jgi:hypothetical protein
MAAAGEEGRKPVLEIYCQAGLAPYCMKPVNNGIEKFKGNDIRQPDGSVRVKMHADIIAHGILWPVLGDPEFVYKQATSTAPLTPPIPPEMSYSSPHVSNPNFQYFMVYDNHPTLDFLISQYQQSRGKWDEKQVELEKFCKDIQQMTFLESREFKPHGQYWLTPKERNDLKTFSPKVFNKVKNILAAAAAAAKEEMNKVSEEDKITLPEDEEAGKAGAAGGVTDGGSRRRRRRRPSRKYKKSKRVLRRKSRSTRRR